MAKVTSKLQITLPKRIAEIHGIVPGDEIQFVSTGNTITIVPGKLTAPSMLSREERLRLFDESTRRLDKLAARLPVLMPASSSGERDWQREDLYSRGSPD